MISFISTYFSYLLSVLGFATMWLAGNKRREAWLLGMCAQLAWLAFALAIHQYGLIFGTVVYFSVYLRNWRRWQP